MQTRVVIAEDHLFVSQGLVSALSSVEGLTVVQTVANGIEAIAAIRKHRPDIAILDYNMPGANGLEVLLEARRWAPETRFLMLTGSMQAQMLAQLVEAGIHGVMLKDGSEAEVVDAVRQVRDGKKVISDSARRMLAAAGETAALTDRELAVVQAIARGHSNISAAALLGISAKTVDTHRTNVMRKLGAHSTASLLLSAVRAGLLDPDSLR
ncbi:MAG: response regulator transcription factor [Rhodobacteraceae bacterium]|jgi:DNA-binding NarL/FixJ family response regulator|nr:response regulator transcription factor [Paracoccaceae bacterium]